MSLADHRMSGPDGKTPDDSQNNRAARALVLITERLSLVARAAAPGRVIGGLGRAHSNWRRRSRPPRRGHTARAPRRVSRRLPARLFAAAVSSLGGQPRIAEPDWGGAARALRLVRPVPKNTAAI